MDFDAMRAAYLRAVEMMRAAFPAVERKPVPVVAPHVAASVLKSISGRASWGSE